MRARCRAFDWATTPLGPVVDWPQSLRTTVDLCLGSAVASFVWWGPELIQLYNDAALAMVRVKHPTVLGQPARVAWEDAWPVIGGLIEGVMATGESVREDDVPLVLDHGAPMETAWFTFSSIPARDERGAVAGVFCTAFETTTRVGAEAKLRYREAWLTGLKEAFQCAINGASLADSLGVLVQTAVEQSDPDVRCAFYLANVERTELTHVTGMLDSYAECVDGFKIGPDSLACGLAVYTRQPVVTPDVTQEPLWMPWLWLAEQYAFRAVWSFPIEPIPGHVIGTFAMYFTTPRNATPRDYESAAMLTQTAAIIISRARESDERARAEAALGESEVRFRTVANLIPDMLWQSEPDGSTPWHNARWLEYTGQTLEEAQGWGWTETIHPDDRARSATNYANATASGELLVQELRIRQYDGIYRWFLARAEPLRDETGKIVCWFGAATDIHAQRMALKEAERLATERTRERDVLRRQLANAEEAERRRLARELHDQLGQELTAFRLGIDDALRLATKQEHFSAAPNSALLTRLMNLHTLANQMTGVARSIAVELRPPELDDVGLASAIETYVREWAKRYNITTDVAVTTLYHCAVDTDAASALYRILQETLTNAAKHAAASRVSVVGGYSEEELRLVIEDDGRGFDPNEVRTRTSVGLGLAGMQERAVLVNGTVTVESTLGSGTTVYVRLPR